MSSQIPGGNSSSGRERLYALLADRATERLSDEEQRELDTLLATHPQVDRDLFDRTAAEFDVHWTGDRVMAMPNEVRSKIVAAAEQHVTPHADEVDRARPIDSARVRAFDFVKWSGWIAAAATIAVLAAVWSRPESAPSLADQREHLIQTAPDEIQLAWTPTAGTFSGDVVWSPSAQRGFVRFRGLEKNDPRTHQYQLWIFDKAQDERYPIDGGVFDIREDGEVIVPIDAKLHVHDLAMLAVTREKPGGVVVSSREGLVGLAKL